MTDTLTVSVLGTGIMGAAMARNLLRAGHTVRVWNRTRAKADALAPDGAHVAATPAEAVESADVVLTMLYDGPVTLETMRAAAPALPPGAVWAQCTTSGIDDVARMAAFARDHGLRFYDSPVLGTRKPAEDGQLTVLAAGPAEGRDAVTPVFDAVGARTVWTGEDGAEASATRLKLVANSWVLAATAAAGETLALARVLDVRPDDFFGLIAAWTARHGLSARQGAADPRGAAVPGPVRGDDRRQGRGAHRAGRGAPRRPPRRGRRERPPS